MGVSGEALQLHIVYKKSYFFTTSHARIHISATSYARIHIYVCIRYYKSCASEHAIKLKVRMIKIIITIAIPERISLVYCRWHGYSCCTLVTIQYRWQQTHDTL